MHDPDGEDLRYCTSVLISIHALLLYSMHQMACNYDPTWYAGPRDVCKVTKTPRWSPPQRGSGCNDSIPVIFRLKKEGRGVESKWDS